MILASRRTAVTALAARLADTRVAEPAGDVAECARRRMFDTIGALAAGRSVPGTGLPRPDGDAASADLVADVRRLCASVRATEVDDIDRGSCTTPGSVAVTVALALGAALDAPADAILAAVSVGYEAMVAVGEAIDGPFVLHRGVWPSYLAAPIAAAATAARLLELDDAATADAIAIASARATGLVGRPGREPTARWFLYGCAAADGVLAAFAAQEGIAGDHRILDALIRSVTGLAEPLLDAWAPDEARSPAVSRTDVKPFCTARQTQAAIEAAQLAHGELAGAAVDTIDIRVPQAYSAMIDQPRAGDRMGSIMSAQFQVAAALTEPSLLYDVVRDPPRLRAAGRALMAQVSVAADPQLDAWYPGEWPAAVTVRTRDGVELTRRMPEPGGAGAEGLCDWARLSAKHARLRALGDQLAPVAERCRGLGGARRGEARALLDVIFNLPTRPRERST